MATRIEDLEHAITAMERQRENLGDTIVDAALASIKEKLVQLESPPSHIEHQRKLLTILFTDIVESTLLGRDRDPEEILEIMDGALQELAVPIGRYGGHVTRYMGDGFKAVFGLPLAHENDAELGIRAALEIQGIATVIARQLDQDHRISGFAIRIGISTGMAAAGGFSEAEDTVLGLTVNLAARMEQAAPSGGLLISHHTYRHVRGVFDLEPVEPVLVKGFTEPVHAYLVKRAITRPFYIPTRSVTERETRLFGRDVEFHLLQNLYLTAYDQSKTQFVTISSDPGIGKSIGKFSASFFTTFGWTGINSPPEIVIISWCPGILFQKFYDAGCCLPYRTTPNHREIIDHASRAANHRPGTALCSAAR